MHVVIWYKLMLIFSVNYYVFSYSSRLRCIYGWLISLLVGLWHICIMWLALRTLFIVKAYASQVNIPIYVGYKKVIKTGLNVPLWGFILALRAQIWVSPSRNHGLNNCGVYRVNRSMNCWPHWDVVCLFSFYDF